MGSLGYLGKSENKWTHCIALCANHTTENIGGKNGCKRTKTDDLDPVLLRCRHFFETLPLAVSRSDQLIHITTIYFHLLRFKPNDSLSLQMTTH